MPPEPEKSLTNPAVIREVMKRHGVSFSKSLGQNFLVNPGVCQRLAELGGAAPGVGVLEIGPGAGAFTAELARTAQKVVAVELDAGLLPVLAETLGAFENIKIIHGDALKLNLGQLIADEFPGMPVVISANLPYYITSPLIMRLLEQRLPVESITLLVQKEAARRICSGTNSRHTGLLTVAVAYYCEARVAFSVSRGSFLPPPEVDSAAIQLRLRERPAVEVEDEAFFFSVVQNTFAQRRKTALNSLAASYPKERVREALLAAGVPEDARGEALSLEDFAAIAEALGKEK